MRSELMAAIYDKALKRKDFSGIVDKDKVDEAKERKKSAAGGSLPSIRPCIRFPRSVHISLSVFFSSLSHLSYCDLMDMRGQIKRKTRMMQRSKILKTTLRLELI